MWWWDERPELYSTGLMLYGTNGIDEIEKKGRRVSSVWRIKKKRRNKRDTHERKWKRGGGCVGTDRRKHTGSITSTTMDLYKPPPHRRGDLFNLLFLLSRLLFFVSACYTGRSVGSFSLPLYSLFPPFFFFFAPLDMGLYILRIVCPLTGNWHSHPPCVVSLTPIDPLPARS